MWRPPGATLFPGMKPIVTVNAYRLKIVQCMGLGPSNEFRIRLLVMDPQLLRCPTNRAAIAVPLQGKPTRARPRPPTPGTHRAGPVHLYVRRPAINRAELLFLPKM